MNDINLELKNISVVYNNGQVALHNVSFELNSGTICGLVGVNGSGKSTLFKSILGFVKPSEGEVLISGKPVSDSLKKCLVSYVPQTENVDWAFPVSVWDVVMMGRYGYMNSLRIPKSKDKEIALNCLKRVNMDGYKDRQIGELSGGQKKRVFLARSLAQQGKIMLLDEPFTGIDVQTEDAIISLLDELKNEGHIILVSTHNLGSVPEFCDQVVIINRTVIAAGPTEKVFNEKYLTKAFGGVLRHIRLDHTDEPGSKKNELIILTDDEGALVLSGNKLTKRGTGKDHETK